MTADDFRVLVVDDHVAVARTVAFALRQFRATVSTADSLAAAEPLLPGFEPHLVITDIYMPGGSGFEVLAAVRRWSVTTPVVAMTAAADVPDLDEAGFVRVLRKPIRLEELAALLRDFRGSA